VFEVYPLPDGLSLYANSSAGEYRIRVPYWKFLPALTGSGTNWFTANAEEWIVFEATSDGFFMDHDEQRGTLWAQRASAKWADVLLADKRLRLSPVTHLVPNPNAGGSRMIYGRGTFGGRRGGL
jgi:hypothetical protein